MISAILVTLVLLGGLRYSRASARGGLITHHTYSNRYNDASAARTDHLG